MATNLFGQIARVFTDPKGLWDDITGVSTQKQVADDTNKLNAQIASDTNRMNYDVAMKNFGLQQENLNYQKDLQQQIFNREDTAYQRTANDMLAAGLNPLSMNGTNGAGEVISTTPSQIDYTHQGYQAQQAQLNNINLLNGISQIAGFVDNMITQGAKRDSLRADVEAKNIKNMRDTAELLRFVDSNGFNKGSLKNQFKKYGLDIETKVDTGDWFENFKHASDYDRKRSMENLQYLNSYRGTQNDIQYGLNPNSTELERVITGLESMLDSNRFSKLSDSLMTDSGELDFGKLLQIAGVFGASRMFR